MPTTSMKITHDQLKSQLSYDPISGIFTWLVSPAPSVRIGDRAGCLNKSDGYRHIKINNGRYAEHVLVYFYITGSWPDNQIDHKDRNRSNNTWDNLRTATASQQQANTLPRPRPKNFGCPRGVFPSKSGRFYARCWIDNKKKHLGTFNTVEEAKSAYDKFTQQHFGEYQLKENSNPKL